MNAAQQLLAGGAQLAGKAALICGDETVSYPQLEERVRRSAGALARLGLQPGERVILIMRDTPAFAAAWLGAIYAGCVAIAVSSRISEADYHHIAADSAARLVIVDDVFALARPDLAGELALQRRAAVVGRAPDGMPSWEREVAAASAADAWAAGADAPAFWLYSSGTTGRPKGIVHSHRAISSVGASFRAFGIRADDLIFATSRMFFAYGLEHGLLAPLALGATALMCADWPDEEVVLALVAKHRPNALFSVPTLYRRLLALPPERLEALRLVRTHVSAGERLSPRLVEQWLGRTGAELLNLYGMSETFCACMVTPPGTSDGMRTGAPLPGVDVRLEDDAGGEPRAGDPGVLWLRHRAIASGYANLPHKTREQFRDGWFCSRDMFIRDAQGYLVHKGRSDELVKIAGQWVHPGEVEELAVAQAAVADAACLPVLDADGLERLALFVTAQGDPAEAARSASEACERELPRHKRPRWIRAVAELPRTATGKVQRYKLREILERELSG